MPVLPKAKRGAQHGLGLGPWPWPGAARSPHRAPGTGQGHVGPAASWSGLKAKGWQESGFVGRGLAVNVELEPQCIV